MLISNSEHNFLCSEASCMFQAFKRYAMRKVQVIENLVISLNVYLKSYKH